MAIQPFGKFLKELSNSAMRTQNRHMRPAEWVRYCSSLYHQMSPREKRALERRCEAYNRANPPVYCSMTPFQEAMCLAMGVPILAAKTRFQYTPAHLSCRSRLLIIARRLGVPVYAPRHTRERLAALRAERLKEAQAKEARAAYQKFARSSTTKKALAEAANAILTKAGSSKRGVDQKDLLALIQKAQASTSLVRASTKKDAPKVVAAKKVSKKAVATKKVSKKAVAAKIAKKN